MRGFLIALGILAVAGCADVPATAVSGPTGETAYSMKCSGMGRTKEDCYRKAGEMCPNGYAIVDSSSRMSGVILTQHAAIPTHQEYMLVTCK